MGERTIKPAENRLLLRDSLYTTFHTSFTHHRDGQRIVMKFSPVKFVRGLMMHVARFVKATSKAAFRLSPEARRHVLQTEGKPYVLHVICNMEIGGSQKIILDLFERMSDRYRMKILTGHIPFYVRYPDLPVTVLNTDSAIRDFLRQERPDVIHFHYWGLEEWMQLCLDTAGALKQELGFRILENSNNPIQVAYHKSVDHYVHVSRFVLDLQTAPISMGKQSVIYPGVDADEFAFAASRRDPLTAGMVYRLTNDKINADTIETLIRICKTVPDVLIYVIGDGPNLRHFIERARREQVRRNIVFTGFVPYERLSEYYEAFNVFLAPVHHESYGVVVPYAMFRGNPVVALQVDAIEELLPGANLRVSTEEDFVATVSGVLQGGVATDEIVRRNRAYAERFFSLTSALAAYDALYQDLLDAQPAIAAGAQDAAALIHVKLNGHAPPYFAAAMDSCTQLDGDSGETFRQHLASYITRSSSLPSSPGGSLPFIPASEGRDLHIDVQFGPDESLNLTRVLSLMREVRERIGGRAALVFDGEDSLQVCRLYPADQERNVNEILPPRIDVRHDCDLSICIPTHNRSCTLTRCLLALNEDVKGLVAELPHLAGGVEVIVVDDGSTDDTLARLEEIRPNLQYRFVVATIPNSGPAAARNRASFMARGRIVVFIDDDKLVERGFLKQHHAFHMKFQDVEDACLGHVDWPADLEKTFLMEHVVSQFGLQQFGYAVIDRYDKDDLPFGSFVTANVSVKREWLLYSGRFAEHVFRDAMWEDVELGWRSNLLGMRLHYVPEAVVYHEHVMTLSDFARRQFKVGQYVTKLAGLPFMEGPARHVATWRTIEAELESLDRTHAPNRIVLACARHLDIHDLLALYDCIWRMEKRLLETWGAAAMHTLYYQLLLVAYLAGTKDPRPLVKREGTADHVAACLVDVLLNAVAGEVSTLYCESGAGVSRQQSVALRVSEYVQPFLLKFDLNDTEFTKLRWSPLRQSACRVRIRRMLYVERGRSREFDGRSLAHNGRDIGKGLIQFMTLEPMFTLDGFSGHGGTVTIEGDWEKIETQEYIDYMTQMSAHITVQRLRRGIAYLRMHGARAFVRRVRNALALPAESPG